jgi:hypothetical protein
MEDCNGFHVRYVGIVEARQHIADGIADPFYGSYRFGTPVADREIKGIRLKGVRVPSFRPAVPITRGEADAAVGLHGESRTLYMSEEQKMKRVQRIRSERQTNVAMEDHIERALGKIAFYPLATDLNNPATVGPRVDEAALRQFVSL